MRLTPLDIRKQEFTRAFRGYEAEEVQAFLQMVSTQWQEVLDEQRRFEERLRAMEAKLAHYEKVEEALQEALQTARESTRKTLENAERKAQLIVEEAEARAVEIKRGAEQERYQLKREASKLTSRRNEIAARLRAFLMSEMELLARFEGDDPIGFIKLLPAEEARAQRAEQQILPAGRRSDDDEDEEEQAERSVTERSVTERSATERSGTERNVTERPAAERAASAGGPPREGTSRSPEREEQPAAEPAAAETRHGQGWTAHSVLTPPETRGRQGDTSEREERGKPSWTDEGSVTASDEEIAKIRRILSDLD